MEKGKNPFGLPLNLQSPKRATRSKKENAIDSDLTLIKNSLEAVSLGVFNNGEYSVSYIEEPIGAITNITYADITIPDPLDAAAGQYTVSTREGQVTTSGNGIDFACVITVREEDGIFSIGSIEILNSGSGFSEGDELILKTTELGGTNLNDFISIVLTNKCLDTETEYYSSIVLDPQNGFYIDGALSIELSKLPTEDPVVYGAVWVDENGFLKISAGE